MLQHLRKIGLAILIVGACAVHSSADVVISVGAAGNTNVNLAEGSVQSIMFLIAEGGDSKQLLSANPIFSILGIPGGLDVIPGETSPPAVASSNNEAGIISASGSTGTENYFGAGNLNLSTIEKKSSTSFAINQEFTNPQALLSSPAGELWFTLNLDTTGLSGQYNIDLPANPDGWFIDSIGEPVFSNNNLTFTVTAVPEPNMLAMLASLCVARGLLRRRHCLSAV